MTDDFALKARPNGLTNAIDVAIEDALAEGRIVGSVVLVAQDGEIVYERAAGLADRETGRQMQVETPFRFASVTKAFTTMAALKLMEAGRLSPEDRVTKYLPGFTPRLADGLIADIRIGQLMAHTAGLDYRNQQAADGPYARAGVSDGLDESRGSLEANLARIANVPLDRIPGEGWRYSIATDVLGGVIEAVTGTTLDGAISTLVTEPLQLGAAFHWPEGDIAVPYHDGSPAPVRMTVGVEVPQRYIEGPGVRFDPERIRDATAWPSGGAGMAGRARDVLTLLEAYRTGAFLGEDLREAARMPRVGAEAQAMGPGWGFSWLGAALIDPASTGSNWGKGSVSWGGTYGNWWGIDFARRRSIISMTNTAYEGMSGRFAQSIAAATAMPLS
ncbi:serine hydrolase domain-containing protein [Mesorhizobium sp. NZP2077]|uniref:serine hydrolase domain-containing protein n=1 Tax=Mesorhizobium sp. NZP2077 TaxID=2483404 RepID=UPI0015555443|nr:serine hydrolase domain-containing protein [Mesorhizobium sp. NZP2077]QKC85222.1 class A beta-lactamase-related serine hydrolase [Mesorhizobium sp. NZP2077]QKD18861.1 beta-lactamase family protein [Mesorhizobium sp. NZP2077]